jgi:integrase
VLPYWGNWPICDIRPSDIDDWIALLAKQMGPVSVRHCYALLRGPLRRAIKDRVIDNPCIDIALPKLPDIRKTFDDVLTAEESERLVNAVADPDPRYASLRTNGRYQALVFMGCWLGPRWNEAIGLRVCDINPLRKELTFGRVVVNQNGTTTFTEAMSKTDDARTVPVPAPVMEALLEHLRNYRPMAQREDFVFLSNRDTHPLRGTFSRDVLGKAVTRAGLTGRHVTWLTLLNCLAGAVPARERVVTCEEVFELRIPLPDTVALQCRQANLEGTGEIRLRRLVKEALRMRPSRIIVGEVRQEECLDLLIALNSGLPVV